MKITARILLILSIMSFVAFIAILIPNLEDSKYCGRIKYKIDATRYGKHNSYADPIFVVEFDELGIKEIHPSWNDYMSLEKGSRVCYMYDNMDWNVGSNIRDIVFLLSILSLLFLFIGITIIIGEAIDERRL